MNGMTPGKRILWHFLLALNLVMAVFLCMLGSIAMLGGREEGMRLGLGLGLLLGQMGFAWRFLKASFPMRVGAAAGTFLLAAIAATLLGALGSVTNRFMYGLWDVVVPYLLVTIVVWEWAYRRQRSMPHGHD
jgi:hypothetical protein